MELRSCHLTENDQIWHGNTGGDKRISWGQDAGQTRPLSQRGGGVPAPSYLRAHSMRNSDQILLGNRTECEENFYRADDANGQNFPHMTRVLFAVVNLLVMPGPK